MTNTEIKEVHRKLALPVKRNDFGKVMPTKFSEKELSFVVFDLLGLVRLENHKKFNGVKVKKHLHKMSKKARKKMELLSNSVVK